MPDFHLKPYLSDNQTMTRILYFVTMLIVSSACVTQSKEIYVNKKCNVSFSTLVGLPELVLVGTDVEKISSFKNTVSGLEGSYSTEIGGAIISISIGMTPNGKFIARTYQEPGIPDRIHRYNPVCEGNGLLSSKNLKGVLVEGGVLLLECETNVEGIPENLWIFYRTKK